MKKLENERLQKVVGGAGWGCWTCFYTSHWHAFQSTARSAANEHAKKYGHKTYVTN